LPAGGGEGLGLEAVSGPKGKLREGTLAGPTRADPSGGGREMKRRKLQGGYAT